MADVTLTVKRCVIAGSGVARVHETMLNELNAKSGDTVIVNYQSKTVFIRAFSDTLIGRKDIRLRDRDLERLFVRKGDRVILKNKAEIPTVVTQLKQKIADRVELSRGAPSGSGKGAGVFGRVVGVFKRA